MPESSKIEYKKDLTDSLEKEVVAFLNTSGGVIYLEKLGALGSGVNRILEYYNRDVFQISDNFIRVVFYFDKEAKKLGCKSLANNKKLQQDNLVETLDIQEKTRVKTKVKESLETRVKAERKTAEKILIYMEDNPLISREDLASLLGITVKGVDWNIKKLKDSLRLERVGSDKEGHWKVIK